LQEATNEGRCGLPIEELIKLATALLEVDEGAIRSALTDELAGGDVVANTIAEKTLRVPAGLISRRTRRCRSAALPDRPLAALNSAPLRP